MNSFDVFDTLLARRYISNDAILNQLARHFALTNFVEARKTADNGFRSLAEIYDHLVLQGVVPASVRDAILKREIEMEIENVFPVAQNLARVQHGDILISDMYLPASAILQMVRSVGLNKQVTLYQSNADKSNGAVWRKFSHRPELHLGDNQKSDFNVPVQHGFNAEHFSPATEPSTIENNLISNGFVHLGLLTREIRLRNTPTFKDHFDLACDYNLPLLFVMAECIHRQYADRNIVFLGRDCQLLHRIYNAYYDLSYYLPFSRKVAFNQPDDAIQYLHTHAPENPLFVDVVSTGGTWAQLQSDIDILVMVYLDDGWIYTQQRPVLPKGFKYLTKTSEIGKTNLLLEVMNCGDHGHLEKIHIHQDQLMQAHFSSPELPPELIADIHRPVAQAVSLAPIYKAPLREEMHKFSENQLIQAFTQLTSFICSKTDLPQAHPAIYQPYFAKEQNYVHEITDDKK
jgi:hypothetical protein